MNFDNFDMTMGIPDFTALIDWNVILIILFNVIIIPQNNETISIYFYNYYHSSRLSKYKIKEKMSENLQINIFEDYINIILVVILNNLTNYCVEEK